MDELFAALDAQLREKMQELLLSVWRKLGLTVIFVIHDIEEALRIAHRVVLFTARPGQIGEIVEVEERTLPQCRMRIHNALSR